MDPKPPAFKMIYQFNLDSHIPKDHFLRLVESVVDFSFVRDLARVFYSDRGAPSVDPVVIFKMSLLGYFYRRSSERRLAEECDYNLAFKWFLKYDIDEDTPDHSIFSKARARFGRDTYEKFFAEIVRKCGEKVFIDATLVKANASRKSIVKREQYLELKQSPKEYLDAVWAENRVEDDKDDDTAGPKGGGGEGPTGSGKRVRTNDTVVSKTDPDASLVTRRGTGPMLAHKVHITVADGKARIVTAVATLPGLCRSTKR
jgi:transposase